MPVNVDFSKASKADQSEFLVSSEASFALCRASKFVPGNCL